MRETPIEENGPPLRLLSTDDIRQLSLEHFSGPLDLLLGLVRTKEIEIFDINLSEITREYLLCLQVMSELSIEVSGEFLAMASILVRLKSRRLLPKTDDDDEDFDAETGLPTTEEALFRRLLELQRLQIAAQELWERPILARDSFARQPIPLESLAAVAEPVSLVKLAAAYRRVVARHTPTVLTELRVQIMSIPDAVRRVARMLRRSPDGGGFEKLVEPMDSRGDMVQVFATLLELARWGYVSLEQDVLAGAGLVVHSGRRVLELAAMDEIVSLLAPE